MVHLDTLAMQFPGDASIPIACMILADISDLSNKRVSARLALLLPVIP
jgi:hypothetical protein